MTEGESTGVVARTRRTSVCSHCGALVGVGESRCMMCGTPVAQARESSSSSRSARPHADPETVRFLRAVISRPATFTFIFIVANVFLYLLMWLSGGANGDVLLAYGAKRNILINEGQWWRFVTPIFLHVQLPGLGPLHLLSNMYGLFMLGPFVEKLYGSARFVVIWVLTGVAGVGASYLAAMRPEWAGNALGQFLFKPDDTASAGASGALFGLMGVLLIFGIKYRHELPEGLKRAFGTGLLPTLLINLFIGYVGRRYIDNAAHLGGLLSGMGLALVIGYKRPGADGAAVARAWHAAQMACLLLVVASFVMVAINFDAPSPLRSNLTERVKTTVGGRSTVVPFVEAINAGQNALAGFLRDGNDAAIAPAAARLEKAPALSNKADALCDELKTMLATASAIAGDKALEPDEREQRLKQLDADFGGWQDRFSKWVAGEGSDFGVGIQKTEKPRDSKTQPNDNK